MENFAGQLVGRTARVFEAGKECLGLRVQGLGRMVSDAGFRVQGVPPLRPAARPNTFARAPEVWASR